MSRVFLDSNIAVYAVTAGDRRQAKAEQLIAAGGVISVQVLNEFVSATRRKLAMPWADVVVGLGALRQQCTPIISLTSDLHATAVDLVDRHGFHIYDACIVAAALEAGCTTLFSEDMQDGMRVDGLTIRNPFAG